MSIIKKIVKVLKEHVGKETLNKILQLFGNKIFVVGGPVRDMILGIDPKDIDFVIVNIPLSQIKESVNSIGKAKEVGESFGIVKAVIDGEEFDFAVPREEFSTGIGHRDLKVRTGSNITLDDDLGRRDFTWNAMAVPLSVFIKANEMERKDTPAFIKKHITDPYGGLQDLEKGTLKAVRDPEERFKEDYLRILRAIQFTTRLGFDIDNKTKESIKKLAPMLHPSKGAVTGERVFMELQKAWTKGHANMDKLVKLLGETNVGKTLFGNEFEPISIKLNELHDTEDRTIGQFVSFFLRGGDYDIMKPPTQYVYLLELAKNIISAKSYPHEYIGPSKKNLYILRAVFNMINPRVVKKIDRMMDLPITPRELDMGGNDIISVLGLKHRNDYIQIGVAQRDLLKAIWDGRLENKHDDLAEYLKSIKKEKG